MRPAARFFTNLFSSNLTNFPIKKTHLKADVTPIAHSKSTPLRGHLSQTINFPHLFPPALNISYQKRAPFRCRHQICILKNTVKACIAALFPYENSKKLVFTATFFKMQKSPIKKLHLPTKSHAYLSETVTVRHISGIGLSRTCTFTTYLVPRRNCVSTHKPDTTFRSYLKFN